MHYQGSHFLETEIWQYYTYYIYYIPLQPTTCPISVPHQATTRYWANSANYVLQPEDKIFIKNPFFSYLKVFLVHIYPKEQNEIIRRSYNFLLYVLQAFHWFKCNARHDWIFTFLPNIFNKNGHNPPLLVFLSVYNYPLLIKNIQPFPKAKIMTFCSKMKFLYHFSWRALHLRFF